jgi:hypothetical protein
VTHLSAASLPVPVSGRMNVLIGPLEGTHRYIDQPGPAAEHPDRAVGDIVMLSR